MSFDAPNSPLPVDEVFANLLQKAKALQKSKARLEEQEASLAARAALEANRIAQRFAWRPEATVALVSEQHCRACGAIHSRFEGFAILMRHQASQTERLLVSKGGDQGLPLRKHIITSTSEACLSCLDPF